MSQHDMEITTADANTGVTFRAAVNAALQALATLSSGATEPSSPYAYQLWADTTVGMLKQRNAGNTAWVSLFSLGNSYLSTLTSNVQTQLDNKIEKTGIDLSATATDPLTGSAILSLAGSQVTLTAQDLSEHDASIMITPTSITIGTQGTATIAAGGGVTVGDNFSTVLVKTVAAPATAASSGVAGEIRFDSNYMYHCVATNTWKRAALSTW